MAAYSMDLRERVVAACDEGIDTRAEIADRFSASESWIRRLLQRRRETGSIAPKPPRRGPDPGLRWPGGRAAPGGRRGQPRRHAERAGGRRRRGLRHLGDGPGAWAPGDHAQKKSLRASEQDRPDRKAAQAARREEFAGIDPPRLVFLDESAATTATTRRYARSPRGRRVDAAVPHGHWKVVTLTAAVRLGEVGACVAFDGATNTACFVTYIGACLVPTLRPGDIVVMDNLPCHKTALPHSRYCWRIRSGRRRLRITDPLGSPSCPVSR
jgi:hypothetical protein